MVETGTDERTQNKLTKDLLNASRQKIEPSIPDVEVPPPLTIVNTAQPKVKLAIIVVSEDSVQVAKYNL